MLSPAYVLSLDHLGRADAIIPKLRAAGTKAPNRGFNTALLAYLLARNGGRAEAQELLKQLQKPNDGHPVPGSALAMVYIGLGDKDAAFRSLEASLPARGPLLANLKSDPIYDPLRGDPRFDALLHKAGLDITFENSHRPPGPPR